MEIVKPLQLPPPRISNSPNVTDNPPLGNLEIGPRNHSNYPPHSNSPNVTDNPPLGNWPEKPLQLPPSNSPNVTDNPPLGNRRETTPTTPPRIHRTLPTNPLLEIGLRNHSNSLPLEFTERYRQPPSWKSAAWETTPTTPPPRIHRTLPTTPPSKYLPRGICVFGKKSLE